ncbi:hypothetical protein K505DRAFT_229197 [Melanomma pulvis-pyrius CBS 109.77]|uniref:Uncharacterized protein n=1 Tax=Melanomma pulvis-pyrius CBS 109.77 TaxID=1314802 RepID=A0A6A6XW45_9PLEO|nr:hypothetical protein K505DRAFT_229197 [Melanomma pulvis-pyrius CBS 109.77]
MTTHRPSNASAFEKAVDAFKKNAGLSQAEMADFQMTSLHGLKVQIAIIQKDQQKSRKMLFLKRLSPFLDAIEQYGKVLEVFLNTSNFVAYIWVCPRMLFMSSPRNYGSD